MGTGVIGGTAQTQGAAAAQASSTSSTSSTSGSQLGENAFLQLLVAQLKYQNPLQPVSNTQFVTQLAQFQMLSVLQNIQQEVGQLVSSSGAGSGGGSTSTGSSGHQAAGTGSAGGATSTGGAA